VQAETQIVELEERCSALEADMAGLRATNGDLETVLRASRAEAAANIAALRESAQSEVAQAAELEHQRCGHAPRQFVLQLIGIVVRILLRASSHSNGAALHASHGAAQRDVIFGAPRSRAAQAAKLE